MRDPDISVVVPLYNEQDNLRVFWSRNDHMVIFDATKGEGPTDTAVKAGGKFWITSTGKTHNSKCRYFGTTKTGKWTNKGSGNNCKICGGAR